MLCRNALPLKHASINDRGHDRLRHPLTWHRPVTVCIAAICRYGYVFDQKGNATDSGGVVVTASDRMLTAEKYGIEYEPAQMKRARLAHSVELLVADDI